MLTEFHRKRVRHYEGRGHLHELTFSCYRRLPLLTNDVWRGLLASHLGQACIDEHFDLVAFVFMPEHVHLVVHPHDAPGPTAGLSGSVFVKLLFGTIEQANRGTPKYVVCPVYSSTDHISFSISFVSFGIASIVAS